MPNANRFLRYFPILLDALRATDPKSRRPAEVASWIRERMEIPEDSLTRTIKNGRQTIFQNDLHWARSHLYKAGLVSSPSYGQWGLTELGRHTHLTDEDARAIFNRVRDKSPEEVEAPDEESPAPEIEDLAELEETPEKASTYGLTDIIAEGCFLPELKLSNMLAHWRIKKNLILQGPPGTGKTWLAKRLGFALIGTDDYETLRTRMRVVQFHPSLSYEDFVRGFRPDCGPDGDGRLRLQEGVMMEAIKAAAGEPDRPFVLVIEEINRGNPAQILGEMLTLLESTKRKPSEAMELTYRKAPGERVYVPDNLHVIGTMNVADRSLALIDLALRRRFAFVDLEPAFGQSWRGWCGGRGIGAELLDIIETRIGALNETIAAAPSLGPQFRIGHSFLTPEETVADPSSWYCAMVKTEIGPLLDEHWYDAPEIARAERKKLLDGFPE